MTENLTLLIQNCYTNQAKHAPEIMKMYISIQPFIKKLILEHYKIGNDMFFLYIFVIFKKILNKFCKFDRGKCRYNNIQFINLINTFIQSQIDISENQQDKGIENTKNCFEKRQDINQINIFYSNLLGHQSKQSHVKMDRTIMLEFLISYGWDAWGDQIMLVDFN